MSSLDWSDDDALMRELGQALAAAEADRTVVGAARGVFAWRQAFADLESDLALLELSSDSLLEPELAVRSAGPDSPRILTFENEGTGVEIEVSDHGIVGQLIPPGPGEVELLTAAGPVGGVSADEVGCFAFESVPAGPIRIAVRAADRTVMTDWVVVRSD
jgi:hypothetical protein